MHMVVRERVVRQRLAHIGKSFQIGVVIIITRKRQMCIVKSIPGILWVVESALKSIAEVKRQKTRPRGQCKAPLRQIGVKGTVKGSA